MKSWKTSLGAALAGLGAAIGLIDPEWTKAGALVTAFGTFFGLLFARDNNVTSEQAGVSRLSDGAKASRRIPILAFSLVPLLALTACRTPSVCELNPESPECIQARADQAGRIAESLAFTGAKLALKEHPEWAGDFAIAADMLTRLTIKDSLTLADVYEALEPLPIDELQSDEAVLIVGNGQILLEEIGAGEIPLNRVPILRGAVAGLARGIQRAL